MTDICPEKIVNTGPIPLSPSPNIANLKAIVWNVHNPVILRLLVCREQKIPMDTGVCQYQDHINETAAKKACRHSKDDLAQIYFRHKEMDIKARSCIVTFIEGYNIHKTDMLFERYQKTVDWLDIAEEKPYFFIVCFGDPVFDNDFTKAYKTLDQKMKAISENEEMCFIKYASRKDDVLDVTHTTKFSVRPTYM